MSSIKEELSKLREDYQKAFEAAGTLEALRDLKVTFFGKKGAMTQIQRVLGTLSQDERPAAGKLINDVKNELTAHLEDQIATLTRRAMEAAELADFIDVTQPARGERQGAFHPVAQVTFDVLEVLTNLGFRVAMGPEVETDYYCFEALNIPKHHPARDMQDTFYLPDGRVLRTHTSPVQIRAMQRWGAPLRVACPGRVYRKDSDPTHSPMFHQVEGLVVDRGISLAHLKGCLEAMVQGVFGKNLKARYRASYFPFTEPSIEMDVECFACSGGNHQCRVCKGTGWLEIGGMGMVHPKVLEAGGIDPTVYTGFAWGMGLDRIAMLKYGLSDLRALFDGDANYLSSGRDC